MRRHKLQIIDKKEVAVKKTRDYDAYPVCVSKCMDSNRSHNSFPKPVTLVKTVDSELHVLFTPVARKAKCNQLLID